MEIEQTKQRFPVGMIIVLILIGWGILTMLASMLALPLSQLGPIVVTGVGARIINFGVAGILITLFYGIIKRLKWARTGTICWYVFSIILSSCNMLAFLIDKTMFDDYYHELLPPGAYSGMTPQLTQSVIFGMIFSSVLGIVIIIYFLKKKDFFVN